MKNKITSYLFKSLSVLLVALLLLSVLPMTAFAAETGVCKIGDTYYGTLQEAFDACPDNTPTEIIMVKDYTFPDNTWGIIAAKKIVTIDLNGKTISNYITKEAEDWSAGGSSPKTFFSRAILNNGKLTVKDSQDNDPSGETLHSNPKMIITHGKIMSDFAPGVSVGTGWAGSYVIENKGTFTLESGCLYAPADRGGCNYCLENSGISTINGGFIYQYCGNAVRNHGNLTMNDGVIFGGGGIINWTGTTFIDIKGGTVDTPNGYSVYDYAAGQTSAKQTIIISGGLFTGPVYTYGNNLYITGGTFMKDLYSNANMYDGGALVVAGGTFKGMVYSYGQYAKKEFVTGGTFRDYKNYDYSWHLYVKDNNCYQKTYSILLPVAETAKYKTLQDYADAGYHFHVPSGNNKYVLTSALRKVEGMEDMESNKIIDGVEYTLLDANKVEVYTGNNTVIAEVWVPASIDWSGQINSYVKMLPLFDEYDYFVPLTYSHRLQDCPNEATKNYYPECYETFAANPEIPAGIDQENGFYVAFDYVGGKYQFKFGNTREDAWADSYFSGYGPQYMNSYTWGPFYNAHPYTIDYFEANTDYTTELLGAYRSNEYINGAVQRNSYKEYSAYKMGEAKIIDPAYTDKTNGNGTFTVVPKELYLGKVSTTEDGKVIISKGTGTQSEITVNGLGDDITAEEAANVISSTIKNSKVETFLATGIDEATSKFDDEFLEAIRQQAYAAGQEAIEEYEREKQENNLLKDIKVDWISTDVARQAVSADGEQTEVTITSLVYEITPVVTMQLKDPVTQVVSTRVYKLEIDNTQITKPVTFRVPIPANVRASRVAVYHDKNHENVKGEFIGVYEVQEEDDEKFVEVTSTSFSRFTFELISTVKNTDEVVITDGEGNFVGYETLADAVAAWGTEDVDEEGIGLGTYGGLTTQSSIILNKNGVVSTNFGSKEITLDLNGYLLSGSSTNAEKVTITNSDETKQNTLGAIGTYKINVSEFVADGFDVKKTNIEDDTVFATTDTGVYEVVVVTSTDVDRDPDTDAVDVYAGDHVYAEVRVYNAKFVAADVTFTYDEDNFELWDSPMSLWEQEDGGSFHFINAYNEASKYYVPDQIDENGNKYYVLGNFEFETKAIDEATLSGAPMLKVPFKVRAEATESYRKTYVTGAWQQGSSFEALTPLTKAQLTNGYANIRLIDMAATVTPGANLLYQAQPQNLLTGFSAKDTTGHDITDAQIECCVITKEQANTIGTQWIYNGHPVYISGTTGKSTYYNDDIPQEGDVPYIIEGPEFYEYYGYGLSASQATDAGDYVVYWKISSPGYVTATGTQEVSIGKQKVVLTWTPDNSSNPNNKFKVGPVDSMLTETEGYTSDFTGFSVEYNKDLNTYANPTASFIFNGVTYDCDVELTTFDGTAPELPVPLRQVGEYVYTASEDSGNFILCASANDTDPTKTFVVAGGKIKGYSLTNGSEGASCYYDGPDSQHVPAVLDIADDANPTSGVSITYYSMKAGDSAGWQASDTIPTFTDAGTYLVKAVATCDGYYDKELETVTFTIKNVDYKVESFDYVLGWDIVLVYTYEDVAGFTYNGYNMYNMDDLGYKFGSTKNADGTRGSEEFTHVFGYLVEGDADITTIIPSNIKATSVFLDGHETKNRYDVNDSNTVETNDLTSVQGTYNVDTRFLADNMYIGLKADVSGDKMVDTLDINLIKVNSDNR